LAAWVAVGVVLTGLLFGALYVGIQRWVVGRVEEATEARQFEQAVDVLNARGFWLWGERVELRRRVLGAWLENTRLEVMKDRDYLKAARTARTIAESFPPEDLEPLRGLLRVYLPPELQRIENEGHFAAALDLLELAGFGPAEKAALLDVIVRTW